METLIAFKRFYMRFLILLICLCALDSFAGTCTSISRTNFSPNTVISSTTMNSQLNTVFGAANDLDGGCVTDGTLELSSLNTTEFSPLLNAIRLGCDVTKSDDATLSVDRCIMNINGNYVKTTAATTVTWGCTSCSSESPSTSYYLYALSTSTGSTLNLLFSTDAPNGDGYDGSNNLALAKFYNNESSNIDGNVLNWRVTGFNGEGIVGVAVVGDQKVSGTNSGTFTSAAWQTRTLNTASGDVSFLSLASNQVTLEGGTYLIKGCAPAFNVDRHKAKLYNVTLGVDAAIGRAAYAPGTYAAHTESCFSTLQAATASRVFEIRHRAETTRATDGFGYPMGIGVEEVYAQMTIIKLR